MSILNKGISTPIAIVIILLLAVLVGGITFWQYSEIQKEEIESSGVEISKEEQPIVKVLGCDWKPIEDYGFCDEELGVYYSGDGCETLSGCGVSGGDIPFFSIEECEVECEWNKYENNEYGYQIKYPKEWVPQKNILGAFDIYKSFYDYNCSVEVYTDTAGYLYPIEEGEGYFQPFSESKITTKEEDVLMGNISGKKLSSPDLGGREIYFFKKQIGGNDYYFNIFLETYKQDPHGEPIIQENKCENIFEEILTTFTFAEDKSDLTTEPICEYRKGEYEMRFYDAEGRMTGVKDGEIKEEIPGSFYIVDEHCSDCSGCEPPCYLFGIPNDALIYKSEIFCMKEGNYKLSIGSTLRGDFLATDIPITSGLTHVYLFDSWSLVEEDGAAIFIDLDGDAIFEKSVISDRELTCEEFIIQLKKNSQ